MEVDGRLEITAIVPTRNEEVNIGRCLASLGPVARILVVDSDSTDNTVKIAEMYGADVVNFRGVGGYPKKRQWVLENVPIKTQWVLLIDADEVVPPELWAEVRGALDRKDAPEAFLMTKGFHFLGRRFRYGGFSHSAVTLFRHGRGRFERLFADHVSGLDMEVHERVIVDGRIGRFATPLIHEDFKGIEAYLERHNRYSTWEAHLRWRCQQTGTYGESAIRPSLLGNAQERRRALKLLIMKLPLEAWLWFAYHYVVRLGCLEGRRGLIASQIRASYINQVRAKEYELRASGRPA